MEKNSLGNNNDFRLNNNKSKSAVIVSRDVVSDSPQEQLRWLNAKLKSWEPSKIIYEFSGPNKDNWSKLITSDNSKVLEIIFDWLGRAEIKDDPSSVPLYLPLSSPTSG
jgi:hypothetical protein